MRVLVQQLEKIDDKNLYRLNYILREYGNAINTIEIGDGVTADNLFCSFTVTQAPSGADTEWSVAHTLGRIPTGAWWYKKDRAGDLYFSATASTSAVAYFKCSTADCSGTIIIV
jgi:hypothetical protein